MGEKRVYTKTVNGSLDLFAALPAIEAQVKKYGNTNIDITIHELRDGGPNPAIKSGSNRQIILCPWDGSYYDVRFDTCGFSR